MNIDILCFNIISPSLSMGKNYIHVFHAQYTSKSGLI